MNFQNDYSLKKINTFGINVSAKYFIEVFTESEILEIVSDKRFSGENKFILGGGSNVLFTKNFDGLVIKNSVQGIKITDEDRNSVSVQAGAGVVWNELVSYAVERNYGGIENLALIPGNVGAAPIQNIGAYGQELADSFESLSGIMLNDGTRITFLKSDCKFSYRDSIFKHELKDKFIITSVKIRLLKNPKVNLTYKQVSDEIHTSGINNPTIRDVSDLISKLRRIKLPYPDEIGNAGSFFKNPVIPVEKFTELEKKYPDIITFDIDTNHKKIAAGWLIEKCGWKGKRIGNVGTHEKHALVVVNHGNATGDEVLEFADRIVESVEMKFRIHLENEVNII
ncbi:MAG TPA: UDP-N-acetylmuramate dehydrogenase [Ignavibacteriaceae bacterium]